MKKILYLISSIKQDGPNRVLENMIYGINKKEYEVYVVSFLDTNEELAETRLKDMGACIINFNLKRKIEILTKGKKLLNEILKTHNFFVVHSHGVLPDIVNAKCKSKVKVTTIHNNMFEDYLYSFGKIKGRLIIKWHLFYLKKLTKCVCCSRSIYDVLSKKINNSTYVQNSIFRLNDINNYSRRRDDIRNKYSIPSDAIVYIYVGGLNKGKNVKDLILNFSMYLNSNEYLLVLGTGPLYEEIKAISNNSNIIFCGFIDNVYDYYCASDIYCSFSFSEGFSISILEALEYNNLLLLNDIPSHNEIAYIDRKYYLGECFNKNNFYQKKKKVSKKLNKYNTIRDVLYSNLNCFKMMEKYILIYEEVN